MTHQLGKELLSLKVCSVALGLGLLSACSLKTEVPPINPNPTDEIIIYGSLPSDQGLDLQMTARFESTNKRCGNYVDISHVYQLSETLSIKLEKNANQYRAHFFRDAIMKGKCDWALIYVETKLTYKQAGNNWDKFYNPTAKDLATKRFASTMYNQEDHLFKIECALEADSGSDSNSHSPANKALQCQGPAVFLMPQIHRYQVDYYYSEGL